MQRLSYKSIEKGYFFSCKFDNCPSTQVQLSKKKKKKKYFAHKN